MKFLDKTARVTEFDNSRFQELFYGFLLDKKLSYLNNISFKDVNILTVFYQL